MIVSLRKASSMAKELLNASTDIDFETSVDANIYREDYIHRLKDLYVEADTHITLKLRMAELAYFLRRMIRKANEEAGINTVLDHLAELHAKQRIYSAVDKTTPRYRDEVYVKHSQERMDRSEDRSPWHDTIDVSPIGLKDDLESKQYALKHEIKSVEEKLSELNYSTKIELDDLTVSQLQSYGVIGIPLP